MIGLDCTGVLTSAILLMHSTCIWVDFGTDSLHFHVELSQRLRISSLVSNK